jgi:menaquinone-dependent protoporphyrinogen IX oxidase
MLIGGVKMKVLIAFGSKYGCTEKAAAYSGTSGRQNRKHPDTVPATSGQ